ncbi:MAG: pyrimidine reductase family protein [Acidimicrobiales bacterium]
MRQLLPRPLDHVDPAEALHALAAEAVGLVLALNMVASIDGATAVAGRSGGLGSPSDKAVFRALRDAADVILVAAGTARAEGYGPPRTSPEAQAIRVAAGRAPHPRIAVVSASLDLDPTTTMFREAPEPPLVLTSDDADAARAKALGEVAEVVRLGRGLVAPEALVAALRDRGVGPVICEGGPTLNGMLVAAGVVDRVHLTTAPMMVGGSSLRVAVGAEERVLDFELASLWWAPDDEALFARYDRRQP